MGRVAEKATMFRNKRHERRRKVEYQLTEKKEEIIREPIDHKTMLSLLESLEKGSSCDFGLLKLAGLQVDTIFPTPSQYLSFPFPMTSLCELAAWRGKDTIVGNLLRAGANPSIDCDNHSGDASLVESEITNINVQTTIDDVDHMLLEKSYSPLHKWAKQALFKTNQTDAITTLNILKAQIESSNEDQFSASIILMNLLNEQSYIAYAAHDTSLGQMKIEEREVLSLLPPPYQVWIVKKIVNMRIKASQNDDVTPVACEVCGVQRPSQLKWPGRCGHIICQVCVWNCLSRDPLHKLDNSNSNTTAPAAEETHNKNTIVNDEGGVRETRFRCPQCASLCDDDEDENESSADYSLADTVQLKTYSLEKFLKLPETVNQLTSKMKAKDRDKFQALSFHQVAGSFIGSVQTVRTSALIRAVESDSVARLRAIFKAGTDLDTKNEYGQTCCHIAAFLDHASSLHFLIRHGADLSVRANDGSDVFTVVAHRKDPATVNVINCHLIQHPIIPLQVFEDMIAASQSQQKFQPMNTAVTSVLIPFDMEHEGAGSRIIDDAFDDAFLDRLCSLWSIMPLAPPEKASCNERAYFCDVEEWVVDTMGQVLQASNSSLGISSPSQAMPHIRFVNYPKEGGVLPPHTDLSRCHHKEPTLRSTFTFLLYLTDCDQGGETALLEHMPGPGSSAPALASVKPKRGRLLLFPHTCPHEGCPVVDTPKLFLRGEFC